MMGSIAVMIGAQILACKISPLVAVTVTVTVTVCPDPQKNYQGTARRQKPSIRVGLEQNLAFI